MTTNECTDLVETLIEQARSRFVVEPAFGRCMVRTPFLYPDNTPIVIAVDRPAADTLVLSDLGDASDYAFLNGVGPVTVRERLKKVERRFGLDRNGDVMQLATDEAHFFDAVSTMVNAVQDIGYLVYRQRDTRPPHEFPREVERFLVQGGHKFERDVWLQSTSRLRKVDYDVPRERPGQLYLWILDPRSQQSTNERADQIALSYIELSPIYARGLAGPAAEFAVLVNTEHIHPDDHQLAAAFKTLQTHMPRVITWQERHEINELLAA